MAKRNEAKRKAPKRYPLLEWASAAVGLLITGVMFGLLAYEAVMESDGIPPVLTVEVRGAVRAGEQYVVEVVVRNASHKTAASVGVEGVLSRGGSQVETSSATIDYVPGESRRRAALIFTSDPRSHGLRLRATGYSRP